MLVLSNIFNGLQVINGGFLLNLIQFLTMITLFLGRLPDYGPDDKERTSQALFIFYGLLVYHLFFAIIRYAG